MLSTRKQEMRVRGSPSMSASAASASTVAYFRFDYPPHPQTFVFQLTDPTKIRQARALVGEHKVIAGTVVKTAVVYNPPWHFYLDPKSIEFPDGAIEACDAPIAEIEYRLASLPADFHWCPWGARILEEVALGVSGKPSSAPPPPFDKVDLSHLTAAGREAVCRQRLKIHQLLMSASRLS